MDPQRFDALARSVASGTSRRSVLTGLVAAVVGWQRITVSAVAAPSCRSAGSSCKLGATGTQAGTCCARNADGTDAHLLCTKIANTGAHRCECDTAAGYLRCGGTCVAINCPGGGLLNTSTCTCECPSGTELCAGVCVPGPCPPG